MNVATANQGVPGFFEVPAIEVAVEAGLLRDRAGEAVGSELTARSRSWAMPTFLCMTNWSKRVTGSAADESATVSSAAARILERVFVDSLSFLLCCVQER